MILLNKDVIMKVFDVLRIARSDVRIISTNRAFFKEFVQHYDVLHNLYCFDTADEIKLSEYLANWNVTDMQSSNNQIVIWVEE